jgi:hypothetical protein
LQGFDDKEILNRLTGNQNDETLPNFIKRKHPKKGREKKTRGKDESPSKHLAQMRRATRRKGNH